MRVTRKLLPIQRKPRHYVPKVKLPFSEIGAERKETCTEVMTVVEFRQVRGFVQYHVVSEFLRQSRKLPVEEDSSISSAVSPLSGIRYADAFSVEG